MQRNFFPITNYIASFQSTRCYSTGCHVYSYSIKLCTLCAYCELFRISARSRKYGCRNRSLERIILYFFIFMLRKTSRPKWRNVFTNYHWCFFHNFFFRRFYSILLNLRSVQLPTELGATSGSSGIKSTAISRFDTNTFFIALQWPAYKQSTI